MLFDDSRLPLIIAFLSIGGIVLAGHTTGRFYPWTLVLFFIAMALFVILSLKGYGLPGIIAGSILTGVAYRLYFNFHTSTPVGATPHGYPERINMFVAEGRLGIIGGYYDSASGAPFQDLLFSSFAIISAVDGYYSLFLYALLIGLLYPLFAIAILKVMGIEDQRILAITAILALVITEGLRRAYWPRNQVIATFFFLAAIYALVKYVQTPTRRYFFLIAGFSVAMAYSHRLPLAIFCVVLFSLMILYVIEYRVDRDLNISPPVRRATSLFIFAAVLVWAQLLYLGQVITHVVRRIFRIVAFGTGDDGADYQVLRGEATAATEALPGIIADFYQYPSALSFFVERGHGVWLLLVAGLAWAYIYISMKETATRKQLLVLLAATATGAALTLIGVVSVGAMNPTRPLQLIEPALVIIIALAIWKADLLNRSQVYQIAIGLALVAFVASQVFAMSAAPDYANSPRYYADAPEDSALTTICEYNSGSAYADHETSWFTGTECDIESFGSDSDSALFNAEINAEEHPSVIYRQDVDVYHGAFERFRLTWDPSVELENEYNSVYDNGSVIKFDSN